MPSSGSPGSRGEKRLELAVDAEARAHFDVFARHARVEAVERTHRRPAHAAAEQVVHAAVARADEALRRVHPAHGTAEVRAAAGDRDVGGVAVVGVGVDFGVVPAHVNRCLARLADVRRHRHDHRDVVVVGELANVADRFPAVGGAFEDRPDRKAERGQRERAGRDRAGGVRGPGHEAPPRDRLALEGSRDAPVDRVLGLVLCVLV